MNIINLTCSLIHLYLDKFSKREKLVLDAILFYQVYQELELLDLEKTNYWKESSMLNNNIICDIVNDLLINDDYSLEGLSIYTGYPKDIIYDLAAKINTNPTVALATKIIELHIMARKEFYNVLIKKAINSLIEKTIIHNIENMQATLPLDAC